MKKTLFFMLIFSGIVILSGCVTPINVQETLQLPQDTKLYTKYNVWYEIPWNISSINYQKGKIIPFGSQIQIVSADPMRVEFQVVSTGRNYTINYYEQWGMRPIKEFIRDLVTTKDRSEQTEGISPAIRKKILMGIVEKGMTRKEVEMAYGPPSPHRTPLKESLTWIYWNSQFSTKRIIFKSDKVVDILK